MLNPTKRAAPAVKKIDAGKATSSSKPKVVFKIEPINIPKPIPIDNKAMFKIKTLPKEDCPLPDANIFASAPFSIKANLSLFLVEKYK